MKRISSQFVRAALCGALLLPVLLPAQAADKVQAASFPGYTVVPLGRSKVNHLILPATIAGKKLRFIVDTGAPTSAIDAGIAQKLSLPPPAAGSGIPAVYTGPDGTQKIVIAPDFKVSGGLDLGGGPMVTLNGLKQFRLGFSGTLDDSAGMMGTDMLVTQHAILNCRTQQLFLNTDPARLVDPSAALRNAGFVRVPITIDGHLYAPCRINGKDMRILIDTGASLTTLDRPTLKKMGVRTLKTEIGASGPYIKEGDLGYVPYEKHEMSIGGVKIQQDITAKELPQDFLAESNSIGLLGAEVLDRYQAVIDFRNKSMWLKAAPPGLRQADQRNTYRRVR